MQFRVISLNTRLPDSGNNIVYLQVDHWNDFSFVTMFSVYIFDSNGVLHKLPKIKIGFKGQTSDTDTFTTLDERFDALPEGYFSLGTEVDFYKVLVENFPLEWRRKFLSSLRDVVQDNENLKIAVDEEVFTTSHLRGVRLNSIKDQFVRVLNGEVVLTDFKFGFDFPASDKFAAFDLKFQVNAGSLPSTNIHALIGRNGVGKTTFLNSMVKAIANQSETPAKFYKDGGLFGPKEIDDDFFSSLISIAFSAFDPFDLPAAVDDAEQATQYSYIGLIDYVGEDGAVIKERPDLHAEFIESLNFCLSETGRKERWKTAVSVLESDGNFADMGLLGLAEVEKDKRDETALHLITKMSSGHTIVLLTLTQLVAKVEEKTLVLFDEPESHLHPPLLSALMRSLSQLLHSRNAIAIIATHSPVVLQEIPKSCVWKVYRERIASEWSRPETETFGENVGTLTREVFGLEVVKSGFHTILAEEASMGGTYEEVLARLGGSLGMEASGILMAMIIHRDTQQAEV